MHRRQLTRPRKNPEVINFYHKKVAVDVFDQMSRQYSIHYTSRRWLLAVWANILDIAVINSWIIYKKKTGFMVSRRQFILKLMDELRNSSTETVLPVVPVQPFVLQDVPIKRRKCHESSCRNNSASLYKLWSKSTCGPCSTGQILQFFFFLHTVHSKQAYRALKRKELLKRKKREEYKQKRAIHVLYFNYSAKIRDVRNIIR